MTRPEILEQYLNPMYDPNPLVIWPSVAPQSLVRRERERERERESCNMTDYWTIQKNSLREIKQLAHVLQFSMLKSFVQRDHRYKFLFTYKMHSPTI